MPVQIPVRNRRCYGNGINSNERMSKRETTNKGWPVAVQQLQVQSYPALSVCAERAAEPLLSGGTTSNGRPILYYGMIYPAWAFSVVVG